MHCHSLQCYHCLFASKNCMHCKLTRVRPYTSGSQPMLRAPQHSGKKLNSRFKVVLVMCILTSEQVLHTLLAGQNHLFRCFNNFFHHKHEKIRKSTKIKKQYTSKAFRCLSLPFDWTSIKTYKTVFLNKRDLITNKFQQLSETALC